MQRTLKLVRDNYQLHLFPLWKCPLLMLRRSNWLKLDSNGVMWISDIYHVESIIQLDPFKNSRILWIKQCVISPMLQRFFRLNNINDSGRLFLFWMFWIRSHSVVYKQYCTLLVLLVIPRWRINILCNI